MPNDYKFNGIELIDDLGLNLHLADFRAYDALIGRWTGVDPKPNPSISTYSGMACNPARYADPRGDTIIISLHHKDDPTGAGGWRLVKEQINDGVFLVLGHSNPNSIADAGSNMLRTGEAIHDALIAADKVQNFNEDGTYKYGGKPYELQVEDGNKVQVILYTCSTACYRDEHGEVPKGGVPIARRFSGFLAEKNKKNLVTGANYTVSLKNPWFVVTPGNDRLEAQTGAWVSYQNGYPLFKRKLNYSMFPGQKYVISNSTPVSIGKKKEKIKKEDFIKY